jgi:hypothetical protein
VSLSKEDLLEIRQQLQGLQAAAAALQTQERRRAPRVRYSARIKICREKELHFERHITVALHDISETGLGVLYDTPLKQGERFVITIEYSAKEPLHVLCAVARCQWWAEKTYLVGMRMLAMADPYGRKHRRDDGLISGG